MRRQGETAETFTDHTDVRPTLLYLTGLADDYAHDGRVIVEALDESVPQRETLSRLTDAAGRLIESVRWTPGGVAGASATDRDRIAVSGGSVPRRTPPPPRAARQ